MPSLVHEGVLELLRCRPELVVRLLEGLIPEGAGDPRDASENLTELDPAELRADAVLLFGEPPGVAVIVEVQLSRDGDKPWTWPAYAAGLRMRVRCPIVLLVVTLDAATERWCRRELDLGPQFSLTPHVVGPDLLGRLRHADDPLAGALISTLAAIATGTDEALRVALEALLPLPPCRETMLAHDMLLSAHPRTRRIQEDLMQSGRYEYQSEFAREHRAAGMRQLLLDQLRQKFGELTAAQLERLEAADDVALGRYAGRVLAAKTVADVLEG